MAAAVQSGLALALDLPRARVWEAMVLSTLPEHPTALQRLLREAQARLGLDTTVLAERAGLNPMSLARILAGDHGRLRAETVKGLSVAFKVPQRDIREASQNETVDYRLPANLASRMTPERWTEVLKIVEVMVSD